MENVITARWEYPHVKNYECPNCEGVFGVSIVKDPDKATFPFVEFCPFCGWQELEYDIEYPVDCSVNSEKSHD